MPMLDEDNKTTMLAALKLIKDTMMERMMQRPEQTGEEQPPPPGDEAAIEEEEQEPAADMAADLEDGAPEVEKKTIVESFVPRPKGDADGVDALKASLMMKGKKK